MDARSALKSKRNYLPHLRDNEKIMAQTIISNGIYWKGFAVLILAVLFLLVAVQLAIFLAVVAVIMLIFSSIIKSFLLLLVTDQRVLVRTGVLFLDTIQLHYNRIESVEIQRTIAGQLFGYGTLMVSGTGSRLAFIPFVANGLHVQAVLNELLQRHDTTTREHMQQQAKIQAEAIADALDDKNP